MRGRRPPVAAIVVVLGALVFTTGAQACSCAPRAPVQALRRADAAIVGHLIEIVPRGDMSADYRYRIRHVYRGAKTLERGETVHVRSPRRASACGLPRRQKRSVGLFLLRDPRGRWTAGLCSMIAPRRLGKAAQGGARASRLKAGSGCTS